MSVPLVRAINLRSLDVLRGLVATYVLLGHARWLLWTGHAAWIKLQHSLAACRTYGDDGDDVIQRKDGRPLYHC